MGTWDIEEYTLQLKYNWKISRNETVEKRNFIIHFEKNGIRGMGEVAPNIRYGETPKKIVSEFKQFFKKASDSDEIVSIKKASEGLSNALRFGIESAFFHRLCQEKKLKIWQLFNIPPPIPAFTSYTIPIMEPGQVKSFIHEHNLTRFRSLKIKVNSENAVDLTREVYRAFGGKIRIDANEAFRNPDMVLLFLEQIHGVPVVFLEQPFPSEFKNEYIYLKKNSPIDLFADESVTHSSDLREIALQFHGINMKLMKAGGYIRGIEILHNAKRLGIKTMIGCMVETSLGIYSALNLTGLADFTDLDGAFILRKDPFTLIKEKTGALFIS